MYRCMTNEEVAIEKDWEIVGLIFFAPKKSIHMLKKFGYVDSIKKYAPNAIDMAKKSNFK